MLFVKTLYLVTCVGVYHTVIYCHVPGFCGCHCGVCRVHRAWARARQQWRSGDRARHGPDPLCVGASVSPAHDPGDRTRRLGYSPRRRCSDSDEYVTASTPLISPTPLATAGPLVSVLDKCAGQARLRGTLPPRSHISDAFEHVAWWPRLALAEVAAVNTRIPTGTAVGTAARARELSAMAVRRWINHGRRRTESGGGCWCIHRTQMELM